MKKRTQFRFMREFANLHFENCEITFEEYEQIVSILDKADERMALESEK